MTVSLGTTLVSTMKPEKKADGDHDGSVYRATRGGNAQDLRDMARMGKKYAQVKHNSVRYVY